MTGHYDILVRIGLYFAFEFLRKIVNDFSDLFTIFHGHRMHHILRQNGIALNKQKSFVLRRKLLPLLFRLHVLPIHGRIFALLAAATLQLRRWRRLEALVEDEGEGGELADRLVDAPRAHVVVRRVLALVVVDEVQAVALGRVGKLQWPRA